MTEAQHRWHGLVCRISGDEVDCELMDESGVRSSATFSREAFSSRDPSYPVLGQKFVLVYFEDGLMPSHRLIGCDADLMIEPPRVVPVLSPEELEEEVKRIFGVSWET
jgi:hypothetical protein